MIYFHKILPILISPLSIIFLLCLLQFFFRYRLISVFTIVFLYIISSPIISNQLNYFLEKDYMIRKDEIPKNYQTIVILSGFLKSSLVNGDIVTEWSDPDRYLSGLELFKKNNLDYIVFTRGNLPWNNNIPEGEFLRNYSIYLGINKEKIIVSGLAKNTEEEAIQISNLPNINKNIVLVTSAFHMKRAKMIFQKYGFNIFPYPVDFNYVADNLTFLDILPNANSLASTSNSIRELIGRLYYRLKFYKI